MKTKRNSFLTIGAIFMFAVVLVAFTTPQDAWVAPAKYKTMQNKYKGADKDGVGADLYNQHCKSCHGKEGFGDGTKAKELKTEMRDFTSEEVQAQTDGELYYKSFIGRDEMPNFEKKITGEEDRWMVVNFMREMAK